MKKIQTKLINQYNNHLRKLKWSKNKCLCGSSKNIRIFNKDRYGIKNPVCLCLNCGIIRANPIPPIEEMDKFYSSDLYRKIYSSDSLEDYFDKKICNYRLEKNPLIYKVTNKFLKNKQDTSILEIGSGGGWNLLPFKEAGFKQIIGYEPGEYLVNLGRKKTKINLKIGFIDDLFKINKKYDLIILNHVIEHLIDPIEKLLQIKDLLNQGGLLYLGLPNIQSYGIGQIQNAHYWYFSPLNFAKLLTTVDYRIVDFGNDDEHMYYLVEISKYNPKNKSHKLIKDIECLKGERNYTLLKILFHPIKKNLQNFKKLFLDIISLFKKIKIS